MLQNNPELKSRINELWNKFWSGGISNPLTAIEQITYLIFMKRMDDQDSQKISDAKFTGENYTSKFSGKWVPPEYRNLPEEEQKQQKIDKATLKWTHFRNMPAENMLTHVQTKVFPFLKDMNGETSHFTHHMKNAVFIIPKPSLLVEAIKTIENIFEIIEADSTDGGQTFQDIQGDVYEYLLSEIATAGKNGQFRTPRHIIKLISELVNPELGNLVADPACGTGGFLLGAFQYMITQLNRDKSNAEPDEDGFIRLPAGELLKENVKNTIDKSLIGFDIDSTMVRLGLMNLMMHGIDDPLIDYYDTLSKRYNRESEFDIVMANPPFTGSIDKGDINENLKLNTTKSELLFVENIYRMLKPGGTAGVIVPQGVLFGAGKAFVDCRKILVNKCELKAVISMPSGVFKPYAGVSTAILIYTKGGETENVWFYNMESDGYSLDDKRNKLDGYGDLQDIIKNYNNRNSENTNDRKAKFFKVPKKEIEEQDYDLSYNRYKEEVFEEIEYEEPNVIINKLEALENDITAGLSELKGLFE